DRRRREPRFDCARLVEPREDLPSGGEIGRRTPREIVEDGGDDDEVRMSARLEYPYPLRGSDVKVGSVAIRKLQRTLKIDRTLANLVVPSIYHPYRWFKRIDDGRRIKSAARQAGRD